MKSIDFAILASVYSYVSVLDRRMEMQIPQKLMINLSFNKHSVCCIVFGFSLDFFLSPSIHIQNQFEI